MLNSKGFTLIEMVFVLAIIVSCSLVSMNYREARMSKVFVIEMIEDFFIEAKTKAIVNKETVVIEVKGKEIVYYSQDQEYSLLILDGYFDNEYSFQYNHNGNIKTAKTLKFIYDKEIYLFVFQVGSGTFYVKDEGYVVN